MKNFIFGPTVFCNYAPDSLKAILEEWSEILEAWSSKSGHLVIGGVFGLHGNLGVAALLVALLLSEMLLLGDQNVTFHGK